MNTGPKPQTKWCTRCAVDFVDDGTHRCKVAERPLGENLSDDLRVILEKCHVVVAKGTPGGKAIAEALANLERDAAPILKNPFLHPEPGKAVLGGHDVPHKSNFERLEAMIRVGQQLLKNAAGVDLYGG